MAQLYLSDLREKTWRGQLGRARAGKLPGGLAYGYNLVPVRQGSDAVLSGERRINPAEAAIVKRIFEAYTDGASPQTIVKQLNAEGVPGPGGREWRDTTIRGQIDRGTGLLNNTLYIGRLEWNRCSYVKDPRTGKRVARVNAVEAREVVEVPELRIIEDALWERVKARQREERIDMGKDENGNALNAVHRRRYLLSGQLRCGGCGGGYTVVAKDRYGCATHRAKGTCGNNRTIRRLEIEDRVLSGLKDRLMAPELVEEFIDEYQLESNRLAKDAAQQIEVRRRALGAVERKIGRLLKAIEDGMYTPSMKERMAALERQKVDLEEDLARTGPAPLLRLHPKLGEVYRDKVERITEALNEPAIKAEATEIIRSLIDRIVLTPVEGGLRAELYGDLAQILATCEGPEKELPGTEMPGSQLSVVAGARKQRESLVVPVVL